MLHETTKKQIYNKGEIKYSIVTPIYNQEEIINDNINSYIEHTEDNFELILIIDCCSDNTSSNINRFFNEYENNKKNFIQLTIIETKEPYFETSCDNIGFKLSQGQYIIEIQADMKMVQPGYNIHLQKGFKILDNIIAISGRCAHNLYRQGGVGKMGVNIEKNITQLKVNKNTFYMLETCNRGPLMLDSLKLKEMKYLDEENYYLNNSDHDLMARSYLEKGYRCGYIPIDFEAFLKNGSRRKPRDDKNKNKMELLNKKINPNQIKKYHGVWKNLQQKTYDISDI